MHRALCILEIAELICAQFSPEGLPILDKAIALRGLSVLARTSAAIFLDPALNVLWRHQSTISNFLKCMPNDVWDITESEEYNGPIEIRLKRPIATSDWDRPLFYCHRVKSFDMDMDRFFEDADFFQTLGLAFPGEFIFPNLRKLRWYPMPSESFHHVRWFLAPEIRDLGLGGIGTISHLSILSTLVRCPSLNSVEIIIHQIRAIALPIVSTFNVPPHLLEWYHIVLWLRSVSSEAPLITPVLLLDNFIPLWQRTAPIHLSENYISMYCVRGDVLLPLFSFANLVIVTLRHPVGFDLDDTTVLGMARAWPRIESLALLAGNFRHVHPRVTLEGLSAFAEHCPHLRTLSMTLDATMVPKLRGKNKKPRVAQESLAYLNVSVSPISNPGRVAVFLSAIFPELQWISTSYDDLMAEMQGEDVDEPVVGPEVIDSHVVWKTVEDALEE
ncbi:hypothetical protein FB451DRAFT_1387525 [Mycena latifolia]|nr:hypothetical protein FB451DRAFT_1387525 [Mycena latifolia]